MLVLHNVAIDAPKAYTMACSQVIRGGFPTCCLHLIAELVNLITARRCNPIYGKYNPNELS